MDVRCGNGIPFGAGAMALPAVTAEPQHVEQEGTGIIVQTEVEEMLLKGAIRQVDPMRGQSLSRLFLVQKKIGCSRQW